MTVLGHYVYGERGNESLEKQFQIKFEQSGFALQAAKS